MDKTHAYAVMNAYLQGLTEGNPAHFGALAITGEKQLGEPDGWVFYWNTQKSVETGRLEDKLVGQGPTIVLADGRLFVGGSGDAVVHDGIERILKRHGVQVEHVTWA